MNESSQKSPQILLAIDFDQTITVNHTFVRTDLYVAINPSNEQIDELMVEEKKRLKYFSNEYIQSNIKNGEHLKTLFLTALEKGVKIVIVTSHNNPALIKRYLDILLEEESTKIEMIINTSPLDKYKVQDKIAKLKEFVKEKNIPVGNVIYLDDDIKMCQQASDAEFQYIHVPAERDYDGEFDDSYIGHAETSINKILHPSQYNTFKAKTFNYYLENSDSEEESYESSSGDEDDDKGIKSPVTYGPTASTTSVSWCVLLRPPSVNNNTPEAQKTPAVVALSRQNF